jgi:hypothetical protein
MKPDRESASLLAEAFAESPDFATEHCDFTVGDHDRGGPEGVPESESPKGYGGADIHRSRRPRSGRKPVVMALQEPHPAPAVAAVRPEAFSEPTSEPDPDFAQEHRHLTVGGSDHYRTRRH